VPEKNALAPDTLDQYKLSSGGKYEDRIVSHIFCEIAVGLKMAYEQVRAPDQMQLRWLHDWGTAVTLAITVEDQSGVNPGLSLMTPLQNRVFTFPTGGNVTSSQSFSLGIGGSATAAATRSETIQFTYTNAGLLKAADSFISEQPDGYACKARQDGLMIESDLKIWEFIYDKAIIAATGNAAAAVPATRLESQEVKDKDGKPVLDDKGKPKTKLVPVQIPGVLTKHLSWPLYNTFTENITFTTTLGGNVTPTWKLARVSANTSGNLLSATRTNTNQLTITMGPIQTQASATSAVQLGSGAQIQHDNTVLSNQIKTPTN